jgi:hypothetical protein
LALRKFQKVARLPAPIRMGLPFIAASVSLPWPGCEIKTWGSFWKIAATVTIGIAPCT